MQYAYTLLDDDLTVTVRDGLFVSGLNLYSPAGIPEDEAPADEEAPAEDEAAIAPDEEIVGDEEALWDEEDAGEAENSFLTEEDA